MRRVEPGPGLIIGGRYELVEMAGRGGMADVWRGRVKGDLGFTRTVAIKQMHTALSEQPPYVAMFIEEARLGAALDSPHVAEVRDFVADAGNYYIVLEWVDGIDLGSWTKWHVAQRQQPRWELVATIGAGLLRALATAHERTGEDGTPSPIIHRDVSPHNILITTRGLVKLVDFGLALTVDRPTETTDNGVVKGKMAYLSPEIVSGGRPIPASDQFACGTVLWETLVGKKLFDGSTDYETYVKVRDCQVPPLRTIRGDVPAAFTSIIHRALSPRPEQRFSSTREMLREMSALLRKERHDLHNVLARTVSEARVAMGMGQRTGDPASTTPVADLREFTPRPLEEDRRGLLHRLNTVFGLGRRRG
jgi:eukaryotic-like serine/threonine-protein kinase